ncbi:hypothetical protein TKK_0009890 [Trichogramma kaykai]
MSLIFILSGDGGHYYLNQVEQHQGHEAQLKSIVEPRQKLTQEHKDFILKYFEAGGIHAKIIDLLRKEYGITISSKDASNVKYAVKAKQPKSLDAVLDLLKQRDLIYEVKESEGNVFQGLFITSTSWIKMYQAWPELVFMDSTYKLIDLEYPVNIAAIVDGNGCTKVVALGILPHEDEPTYVWYIERMQKYLYNLKDTEAFMTDKYKVYKVIKDILKVDRYICTFHVVQAFKRHVNSSETLLSRSEKDVTFKYLYKLVYAHSQDIYANIYEEFISTVPLSIVDYFIENWSTISHKWVRCMMTKNLYNFTNNRVESLNGKLKKFIKDESTIYETVTNLLDYLKFHENERNFKAIRAVSTRLLREENQDKLKYFDYLTPYAYKFVCEQMEKSVQKVFIEKCPDNYTGCPKSMETSEKRPK